MSNARLSLDDKKPLTAFGYRLDERGVPIRENVDVSGTMAKAILGKWPDAPCWIGTERMDPDTPKEYVMEKLEKYIQQLR